MVILDDININILDFPSNSDEYAMMLSSFGLESLLNCLT